MRTVLKVVETDVNLPKTAEYRWGVGLSTVFTADRLHFLLKFISAMSFVSFMIEKENRK